MASTSSRWSVILLIASIGTAIMIVPGTGIAGTPAQCDAYAHTAVAQDNENLGQNCHFSGVKWSQNSADHRKWCLAQSDATIQAETAGRQAMLNRCVATPLHRLDTTVERCGEAILLVFPAADPDPSRDHSLTLRKGQMGTIPLRDRHFRWYCLPDTRSAGAESCYLQVQCNTDGQCQPKDEPFGDILGCPALIANFFNGPLNFTRCPQGTMAAKISRAPTGRRIDIECRGR